MRVNSAKAMVSSAKYTPEMPKRKARKPMTAPARTQTRDRRHTPEPRADAEVEEQAAAT